MKKLLIISLFLLVSCDWGKVQTYNTPFVPSNSSTLYLSNQKIMCDRLPESEFCTNGPSVGDLRPTRAYAVGLANTLAKHHSYELSDEWYYNHTCYESLVGDCEDVAMTIAKHMIDDGYDKKYIVMVYRLLSPTEAHIFLAINTSDYGWIHIDYAGTGGPLEEEINYHMLLTDVGVYKWIKGNIEI